MSQVDEGLIHAWLDGQLQPDEAARVEHLVATDASWGAAAGEARGYMAGASRILGALDDVPAVLKGAAPVKAARRPSVWWRAPMISAAASVVLVVGVSTLLWRRAPEPARAPITDTASPAQPTPAGAVSSSATVAEQRASTQQEVRNSAPNVRSVPAIPAPTAPANIVTGATTAANEAAPRPVAVGAGSGAVIGSGIGSGIGTGRATAASLADRRDAGIAQSLAAKALAPDYVDPVLAGCWETIDHTTGGSAMRERAGTRAESGALIRFASPGVTDVVRSAPPPSAAAVAPMTPGVSLQNAVARRINDSTFVTEWFRNAAREQVTFTLHADTMRGRVIRGGQNATVPGAPFLAIRRACPQ